MFHLLHTFVPQKVLITLGPISIYWYGLLIALAMLAGALLVIWLFKKYGLKKEDAYDLIFWVVIVGLIFDRLFFVAYAWDYYSQNLLDIFKIWQGGLAIYGGMIGGILALYFFAKKRKINFWFLADIVAPAVALGLAIGRWGNWFNQELFGRPTNLPWGIPIELANRPAGFEGYDFFQPTFLYESLGCLLIFGFLVMIHKFQIQNPKFQTDNKIKFGNIFLGFLALYSLGRFFNEFLRIDESPCIFGWRWFQVMAGVVFLVSLAVIIYKNFCLRRARVLILTII